MKDTTTQKVIEIVSRYGSLERIRFFMSIDKINKLECLLNDSSITILDIVDSEFPAHRVYRRKGEEFEDAIFSYTQCIRIYAHDSDEDNNDYYHSFVIVR